MQFKNRSANMSRFQSVILTSASPVVNVQLKLIND